MKIYASKKEIMNVINGISSKSIKIKAAIAVQVTNLNEYESGKSCNGGCYSFTERYWVTPNGFEVEYDTSSEFQYCPYMGVFCNNCCIECSLEEKGTFDQVCKEDLIKRVNGAKGKYEFSIILINKK